MSKFSSLFLRTQQSVEEIRQIHKQPDFKQNVIHKGRLDKYCWASMIMKVNHKSFWCQIKLLFRRFPGRRQGLNFCCELYNIRVIIFVNYLYYTQHKQRALNNSQNMFTHIQKVTFGRRIYEPFYVNSLSTHFTILILPKIKGGGEDKQSPKNTMLRKIKRRGLLLYCSSWRAVCIYSAWC